MIYEALMNIQEKLKAPKGQTNKFGGYQYRSCEDILTAVKPLLRDNGCTLTISDDIVDIGGRVYVKATASIHKQEGKTSNIQGIHVAGFARESETKKGMDDAQITGSASSYARKYALNGLFAIDDTKDADATNDHGKGVKQAKKTPPPKVKIITQEQAQYLSDLMLELGFTDEQKAKLYSWDKLSHSVKQISALAVSDYGKVADFLTDKMKGNAS